MNPNLSARESLPVTATDVARQQYFEELLENSRKRIALLRARTRSSTGQKIRMKILLEEAIASNAERELERLKRQSFIL